MVTGGGGGADGQPPTVGAAAHAARGEADAVALVERAYACLADADLDGFLGLLHRDVVLTQDPALPWGGRFEGHDGVATFAITLVSTIRSKVEVLAMFAAGEQVVQYGRTRGEVVATGATFDIPECHVWTVVGGSVTAMAFYIDGPAMLEALQRP